jgi:sRNA-binding carbon storage regulator CsrA
MAGMILRRKTAQTVVIVTAGGERVEIEVIDIRAQSVLLQVRAPATTTIDRGEIIIKRAKVLST